MKQKCKLFQLVPLLIMAMFVCLPANAQKGKKIVVPQLFNMDYNDLLSIREDLKQGKTKEIAASYENLIARANRELSVKPFKVTDGDVPPTGDVHDYFTIGKYAWKNPNTPDGMPYIRGDGKTNPESQGDKYDMKRFNKTVARVNLLALAWFYSGDERYAKTAAEQLRVWYINPETRMNPNFNCGSALPGVYNGMAIGIIFGAQMVNMLDHVQLLTLSKSWTKEDNEALKKWFLDYAEWLATSKFGIEESKAVNNHRSWYLAQLLTSLIYGGGRQEDIARYVEESKKEVVVQVAAKPTTAQQGSYTAQCPRGSLPPEMKREDGYHYSIYGMQGLCNLAAIARTQGADLWKIQAEDGRGLQLAFDFYLPYFTHQKPWEWRIIGDVKKTSAGALPIVRQAARVYETPELKAAESYLLSIVPTSNEKVWLEGKNSPVAAGNTKKNPENKQEKSLNLVVFDYDELVQISRIIREKSDANVTANYNSLIESANKILDSIPKTVLDGAAFPGASPHDFWMIGGYYFFENGKWVYRDGKKNPETTSEKFDGKQWNTTTTWINTLALAWFYSQDEKYATKATEFIRVWFLNEDTKMNPNFEYGCARDDKREETGIIYGAQLVKMLDGVRLIALSKSWTAADDTKLKQWFKDYNHWLLTSKLGKLEGQRGNNHEAWYTAQVAAGAIYYGDNALVKQMVEKGKKVISWQISRQDTTYTRGGENFCPKGSLWREIYRATSLSYSLYGLRALCAVAGCADAIGEDLWNYTDSDGRNLSLAFDFIAPYLTKDKEWTWKGGSKTSTRVSAIDLVRKASRKIHNNNYQPTFRKLYEEAVANKLAKRTVYLEGLNL